MDKREGEYQDFSVEIFLSHCAKRFCREILKCAASFKCRKILCLKGLCHDFLSMFSLSNSTEEFRGGSFLSFSNFLVSKNFMDEIAGEYQDFPLKLFGLTVPKNFVGDRISGIEKC